MNSMVICRLFDETEYWLFTRGGACPQDGWRDDETGAYVTPPAPDALVEWETEYGYNTCFDDVEKFPVKVMNV